MLLKGIECPCGCRKIIVHPLFGCQCSSLTPGEASELIRRWNHFEEKIDHGKMFKLAEDPFRAECDNLGIEYRATIRHKNTDGLQVRAVLTGETRAPNQYEWYLSGSIPEAYRAPNDLTQEFKICKLVLVQVTTFKEETVVTK